MSIHLVVEVFDHYHGPDKRKLWLLAFAESANDKTRIGWPHRTLLARRIGVSESRASHIAAELLKEGTLSRVKQEGERFRVLDPETDEPAVGNRGGPSRFKLNSLKGALRTHPSKSAPRTHPKPQVKGAESARKGAESARKGAASTPLPAETSPLPLSPLSTLNPLRGAAEPHTINASHIVAAFVDGAASADQPKPAGSLKDRVGKQARTLLAEGTDPDALLKASWNAGAGGWTDLAVQVQRDAANGRSSSESTADKRVRQALASADEVAEMLGEQGVIQ